MNDEKDFLKRFMKKPELLQVECPKCQTKVVVWDNKKIPECATNDEEKYTLRLHRETGTLHIIECPNNK